MLKVRFQMEDFGKGPALLVWPSQQVTSWSSRQRLHGP